jgi:hypothetical protein
MAFDSVIIDDLIAAYTPVGPLRVCALRPVLYVDHSEALAAVKCLQKRVAMQAAGVDELNDLEKLGARLLIDAAGIRGEESNGNESSK